MALSTSDSAQYNFEQGAQAWIASGAPVTAVAASASQSFSGAQSLAVTVSTQASAQASASVANASPPAGSVVTYRIYIPAGSAISAVQPFVLQGAQGGWSWTGNWQPVGNLIVGAWNTIAVTIPQNAALPLYELGVQFYTSGVSWTGMAYIDSVSWPTAVAPVQIAISPSSVNVKTGATAQFGATVTGTTNPLVAWSLREGAAAGSVSASGLYTASATAGTYHVVATSQADASKIATATVVVAAAAPVQIAISPASATVGAGATAQFTATLTGTTNTNVTWSLSEGAAAGSVSASGLYTASTTPGTYHVVATSQADTSKKATAAIVVAAGASVQIAISPSSVNVNAGTTAQFTATVTGTSNINVTWALSEGAAAGLISASGLYTASASAGTYHVVATSQADASKKATATITTTMTAPIAACSGPVGQWQNITPPQLKSNQWCAPNGNPGQCPGAGNVSLAQVLGGYSGQIATYGAASYALDPIHPGTLYLGTSSLGIWKSTDCGATWTHADTGTNSDKLDAGRQNALIIDPLNPEIIYAGALYGAGNIWQSLDGGNSWKAIITASGVVAALPYGGFLSGLTMDPGDHNHLASSPHAVCSGMALPGAQLVSASGSTPVTGCTASAAPNGAVTGNCPVTPNSAYSGWSCLIDGHYSNGSWSWTLVANGVPWGGDGGGVTIIGGNRWVYGGGQADVYLTTNGGGQFPDGSPPWQRLFGGEGISTFYRASNKMWFTATGQTLKYSADNGSTWTDANVGGQMESFADDGTTMYLGGGFFGPHGYLTSPLASLVGSSPTTAPIDPPHPANVDTNGGVITYDPNFKILYSANGTGGMFRRVVK